MRVLNPSANLQVYLFINKVHLQSCISPPTYLYYTVYVFGISRPQTSLLLQTAVLFVLSICLPHTLIKRTNGLGKKKKKVWTKTVEADAANKTKAKIDKEF